jgi:hypothetical protein
MEVKAYFFWINGELNMALATKLLLRGPKLK